MLTPLGQSEGVIKVEDWAEIRRLHLSEQLGVKTIARRLGLARNTVRSALASDVPPKYERDRAGSRVDEFEPAIRRLLTEFPDTHCAGVGVVCCGFAPDGRTDVVCASWEHHECQRDRAVPARPGTRLAQSTTGPQAEQRYVLAAGRETPAPTRPAAQSGGSWTHFN